MTRREFIAAVSAAGLLPSRAFGGNAVSGPLRQARILTTRFGDLSTAGSDEFKSEKDALELEARLGRIFAGHPSSKTLRLRVFAPG